MRKLFDLKVIFLSFFLLLTIAIKNSENFQLRDFNDGVSESSNGRAVSGKQSTKVRYSFRKLEKVESSIEDNNDFDDDDDDEDDNDDQNDSQEDNYKFDKVRKPTFEVKKRTNLRHSKLAQFREPADDDDNDESSEEVSLFSKILNFFKRKPKETSKDDDDDENESKERNESAEEDDDKKDDDDGDDDDDDEEKKPLLTEIYDKFKDFLDARSKKSTSSGTSDEDDDDGKEIQKNSDEGSGEEKDGGDDDDDDDDDRNVDQIVVKPTESQIKVSIKETFTTIFNRCPFNWIYNFDDGDDDEETQVFEDSEEDELNYQRLLKEERDQAKEHTEQLIKQTSEEDVVKVEAATELESLKEIKKPTTKKEKKTKEEAYLAKKEFEKLILSLPSFVPDYSKVKNPECQKQGEVFQRQLRGQRIWALEMMDANAKIPSGLMRGNTNQLGDFDLCTKISQKIKISHTNSMKMKGKYCLANIDVVAAADQLKLPVHLIQGRNFIRSTINDVSFIVNIFKTVRR